jgi:hypothetical protein
VCEGRAGEKCSPREGPTKGGGRGRRSETELLAGGMKWVGGEVIGEAVKAQPGKEERIRAPRAEMVDGNLGVGKKAVPEVVGEVGVDGRQQSDEVVLAVLIHCSLSAG